uniref:Notch C-terminal domain-containing protein n=2 Tax=Eptatretus burgeri TaxID=7764 RepID=A0A8C4RDL1_EPTBU
MLASLRGGGLDTSAEEEEGQFEVTDEVAGSASVITDLIFQGASLHAQTDRTGETALHLAARYARADAAKRLLDSGADANVADNTGRTPLHAAVAADAQGVFQILIRNRATDLDARMHDGTTALVLAARLAVEGMVEELVASHADINAVDDLGKSALHWAAAVNNVEAMMVLLKHGANKDMQDNKEETPLFLAAREGSLEAVRILLEHGANRDITDHMDRLPRDAARDRHHHDILHLLDQLGPGQGCAASVAPQTTLVVSPPHCTSTVTTFLPGGVTASPASGVAANVMIGQRPLLVPQGKKGRRANSQRGTLGGKDGRGKKGKGTKPSALATLDAGGLVPSPAESLDSPCGNYTSDSLSPPLLSPPGLLHTSPSLRHLHSTSPLYESGAPPRLSHLPLPCDATAPPRHDWIVPTHITMGHYAHGNTAQTGTVQRMLSLPHGITYQRQHSNASAVFCGRLLQDTSGLQYTQTGINTQVMPVSVPMYPTPPSQHSYASVAGSCRGAGSMAAMQPALGGSSSPHEATPAISFPDIAYLTPSPDSPEAWSSSSPHSASDWSEGVSSPPTDQLAMTATIMT